MDASFWQFPLPAVVVVVATVVVVADVPSPPPLPPQFPHAFGHRPFTYVLYREVEEQ